MNGFNAPCQMERIRVSLSIRELNVFNNLPLIPKYMANTINAVIDDIINSVTAPIPPSASLNAVATVAQKKTTNDAITIARL
jgi:hypothetical protein